MDLFQCPQCALKFRYSSELEQHLKLDHPDFELEEDERESAARKAAQTQRDLKKP